MINLPISKYQIGSYEIKNYPKKNDEPSTHEDYDLQDKNVDVVICQDHNNGKRHEYDCICAQKQVMSQAQSHTCVRATTLTSGTLPMERKEIVVV